MIHIVLSYHFKLTTTRYLCHTPIFGQAINLVQLLRYETLNDNYIHDTKSITTYLLA